jgi:signal transduction histidine kinase
VSRKTWAFDIGLAVVVGAFGQLEAWWGVGATHQQGPLWVQSVLYAATAVLLAFRRVRPLGCLTAMTAVSMLEFAAVGSPEGFAVALAPNIAIYTVGRRTSWRKSWWGLVLGGVLWTGWALFDPTNRSLLDSLSAMVWIAPSIIAWLLGTLLRISRLNADQRRINLEQRAARAVIEERTRIARELHDVIGHSVSVMTVQASAVRRRLTADQEVEREALETVEATGREALAEMRRVVGVLRDTDTGNGLTPPPGLDQLDRLVEKFRSAGLPVSVTVTGTGRRLAPGVDLTAYRLVQEGLTNTLRHASHPRQVEVAIDYRPNALVLAVRDDGQPTPPADVGAGLLGLQERVSVYGGSLVARVQPGRGFELIATLPLVAT